MELTKQIEDACRIYINAVLHAKNVASTSEEFWGNRRAQKAHSRLFEAIESQTPADLKWRYTVWELAGSTSEEIFKGEFDPTTGIERFIVFIRTYITALEGYDWIACLPLERVFCKFPDFTDLGEFALVNVTREEVNVDELLGRFRNTLADKFRVNFVESTDPNVESYLRLGDHFFNKSGGYIPGRPQMVVKVGRGDRYINERILSELVSQNLAILAVCQIEYELHGSLLETRIISSHGNGLPDGSQMQRGLIEIPSVAVAINRNTGQSDWWGTKAESYETQHGIGYDSDRFMKIWNETAAPLLRLRGTGLSGKIRTAIDNAIRFVARCRHAEMGDLALHSVIATETILNPINPRGGTSERFAIFAAALTGRTIEERKEVYNTARQLYNLRSSVVHQSNPHCVKPLSESRKKAFGLFLSCLTAIIEWAGNTLSKHGANEADEFKELYIQSILSAATTTNDGAIKSNPTAPPPVH